MLSITKVRAALEDGLLSFPITDFDDRGEFDSRGYAERLEWFVSYPISSIFVAGGTGEFFSLSVEEYKKIVETATHTVRSRIPVISSVGRSLSDATAHAKIAEAAGIDALLLFPPYLTECPQEGVYEYAKSVIDSTNLPVIYYNRGNGVLTAPFVLRLAAHCQNFIALKDGTGNIQDLNETIKMVGDRLSYIGGVPTAEVMAEAYLSIGVNTYSSAVFNFVPEFALQFYRSLRSNDKEAIVSMMKAFYIPLVRLRGRQSGYAVSLIKAGAKIVGKSGGNVRAPLTMPSPEEISQLQRIIEDARACVIAGP